MTDGKPNDPAAALASAAHDAIVRDIEARLILISGDNWTEHETKVSSSVCLVAECNFNYDAKFIAHAPADIAYLLTELRMCRAAFDSATFLLGKREATIAEALAAASEGRWTTVRTLLEGGAK